MCSEIKVENAIVFTDVIGKLSQLEEISFGEDQQKWPDQLTQLALIYGEVSFFAHEFDYSPSLRYNGVRSYMKMVLAYFVQLCETVDSLKKNSRDKKSLERLKTLQGQCSMLLSMGKSVKNVHQIWSKYGSPASKSHEFYSAALENKINSVGEMTTDLLSDYYNLESFAPWLPSWVRYLVRNFVKLYYLSVTPIHRSLFGVWYNSTISRFWAENALSCQVDFLKKANDRVMENWLLKSYCWMTNLLTSSVEVSYVTLHHRQMDYFIDVNSKSIVKTSGKVVSDKGALDCVFIKPRNFTSGNLIIHIHGGGFITATANSSIPTLKPIVEATGAAVLSINYTLSPQAKYPQALQEILDVYINLHSSSPITRFKATKVTLLGESAGGHYVIALAIALAELRCLQESLGEQVTPLPHSIVSIFPNVSCLIGHSYPARVLIDLVLLPVCPYSFFNAYSGPIDEKKYREDNNGSIWHSDVNLLRKVATEINSRLDDPFIHLIGYNNFHLLKDVPLCIQVGEFDPTIDDSIHLAKTWQGEVTLDIIPDMPHSWVVLETFAPKSFTGGNLMRQRIKEAIEREANIDSNGIKVHVK